ncbi:hypothetical protein O3M35_003732 [Rhynocoris fuscipes]|uniref:CCC domain-containing protein n=1 Tax=Rhynocoris fuscipes TaxID=488301 RepID=A0AAW1CHK0_9HEMI
MSSILVIFCFILLTYSTATVVPVDNVKRPPCPYCDSSVYSYCSGKLLHDACCCLNPYEHELPIECKLADCSFLHANSCREHFLITRCCCNKVL